MGAKINIAGQLADNFEVTIGDAVAPQRRNPSKGGAQTNGSKVDEKAEFLANFEQARFGAILEWQRIPLGSADRAEKDGVGSAAACQGFVGKRNTETVDRRAAKGKFAKFEFVLETFGAVFEDLNRGAGDFRADAVALQYRDRFGYASHE